MLFECVALSSHSRAKRLIIIKFSRGKNRTGEKKDWYVLVVICPVISDRRHEMKNSICPYGLARKIKINLLKPSFKVFKLFYNFFFYLKQKYDAKFLSQLIESLSVTDFLPRAIADRRYITTEVFGFWNLFRTRI